MAKTAKKPEAAKAPKRPAAKKKRARRTVKPDPERAAKAAGWESDRAARVSERRERAAEENGAAEQYASKLGKEPSILALKSEHGVHAEELSAKLAGKRPGPRVGELQRQYGAAEAEKAMAQRDANLANDVYRRLMEGGAVCGECGTPIHESALDEHLSEAEQRVASANGMIATSDAKLANIGEKLHNLITGEGDSESQSLRAEIEESLAVIAKCDQALEATALIRSKMVAHRERAAEFVEAAEAEEDKVNPFAEASA